MTGEAAGAGAELGLVATRAGLANLDEASEAAGRAGGAAEILGLCTTRLPSEFSTRSRELEFAADQAVSRMEACGIADRLISATRCRPAPSKMMVLLLPTIVLFTTVDSRNRLLRWLCDA
ncbi:MAG: hypothetical protein FJ405_13925 [Verrucomicrobia bacterium]|nr:hypothetical protein [Verrucomicrobiota bacterium]